MPDSTPVFIPTLPELDMLHQLASGEPIPFPEEIKGDFSERLYENGFITVGLNGGLALTDRGQILLDHARAGAPV